MSEAAAGQLDLIDYLTAGAPPATPEAPPFHQRPAGWRRLLARCQAPPSLLIAVRPDWTGVVIETLHDPAVGSWLLDTNGSFRRLENTCFRAGGWVRGRVAIIGPRLAARLPLDPAGEDHNGESLHRLRESPEPPETAPDIPKIMPPLREFPPFRSKAWQAELARCAADLPLMLLVLRDPRAVEAINDPAAGVRACCRPDGRVDPLPGADSVPRRVIYLTPRQARAIHLRQPLVSIGGGRTCRRVRFVTPAEALGPAAAADPVPELPDDNDLPDCFDQAAE